MKRAKSNTTNILNIYLLKEIIYLGILFSSTLLLANEKAKKPVVKSSLSIEEKLLQDAEFSYKKGDLYQSYRFFENGKFKVANFWEKYGSTYVKVLSDLSSPIQLIKECANNYAKTKSVDRMILSYHCSKELTVIGYLKPALKLINKVKPNKEWQAKYDTLLASIYLGLKSPNECLQQLNEKKKDFFVQSNLSDIYHITRARCLSLKADYYQAYKEYQQVYSSSPNYLHSLQEMVWIQFKRRDIESTKTLTQILLSAYSGQESGDTVSLSSNNYFQVRYVRSYLELVQGDINNTNDLFSPLRSDFGIYQKSALNTESEVKSALSDFFNSELNWINFKNSNTALSNLNSMSKNWLPLNESILTEKLFKIYIATKLEMKRIQKIKSFSNYTKAIAKLNSLAKENLNANILKTWEHNNDLLTGFDLKLLLGKNQIQWIKESNGLKSLDDAIKLYEEKQRYLSSFLGDN